MSIGMFVGFMLLGLSLLVLGLAGPGTYYGPR